MTERENKNQSAKRERTISSITISFNDGSEMVFTKEVLDSLFAVKNVIDIMGAVGLIHYQTKGLLKKK